MYSLGKSRWLLRSGKISSQEQKRFLQNSCLTYCYTYFRSKVIWFFKINPLKVKLYRTSDHREKPSSIYKNSIHLSYINPYKYKREISYSIKKIIWNMCSWSTSTTSSCWGLQLPNLYKYICKILPHSDQKWVSEDAHFYFAPEQEVSCLNLKWPFGFWQPQHVPSLCRQLSGPHKFHWHPRSFLAGIETVWAGVCGWCCHCSLPVHGIFCLTRKK